MRKLIIALLLVVILLTLFVGVVSATCPEYEDKYSGAPKGNGGGNPHCVTVSSHAGGAKTTTCASP